MLPEEQLRAMVSAPESVALEKKRSAPDGNELRKSLVSFANSLPEGQYAVLLIGVGPDDDIRPVDSIDEVQKKIVRTAQYDCFPPISCVPQAFTYEANTLLAVIVYPSKNRPHFAGLAYVREGSVSRAASAELFERLVASRNSKVGKIQQSLGEDIWVQFDGTGNRKMKLAACDSWVLRLLPSSGGHGFCYPLEKVSVSWNPVEDGLLLQIAERAPFDPDYLPRIRTV